MKKIKKVISLVWDFLLLILFVVPILALCMALYVIVAKFGVYVLIFLLITFNILSYSLFWKIVLSSLSLEYGRPNGLALLFIVVISLFILSCSIVLILSVYITWWIVVIQIILFIVGCMVILGYYMRTVYI